MLGFKKLMCYIYIHYIQCKRYHVNAIRYLIVLNYRLVMLRASSNTYEDSIDPTTSFSSTIDEISHLDIWKNQETL